MPRALSNQNSFIVTLIEQQIVVASGGCYRFLNRQNDHKKIEDAKVGIQEP